MVFKKKSSRSEYNQFIKEVALAFPQVDFEFKNVPIYQENPRETPDHYSIFSYWLAKKISATPGLNVLDVGNSKYSNFFNSISHSVTALVLEKPSDHISPVNWVKHDVSDPLPFPDSYFDIFTSASTLHLIGLGRYGDKKNPYALVNLLSELDRVMASNSKLYLMLPLGRDQLLYGLHYIFSFSTIQKMFGAWRITDFLVDEVVKFGFKDNDSIVNRFTKNTDISEFKIGQYKILYLELTR